MRSVFTLLNTTEYVEDIITKIHRAKHQIYLLALVVTDDDDTTEIIKAITEAAARGVDVNIGMDMFFSYREFDGTKSPVKNFRSHIQGLRHMKQSLEKSGARVTWLGQAGPSLFARRTHTKWLIIDATIYCFGGINLYSKGLASADFMFRITDQNLALRIAKEHLRIIASDRYGSAYPSHQFGTADNLILIDGGFVGDSIIYRRACHYASKAKHITYVSQYNPSGKLGRILKQKPGAMYFNRSSLTGSFNYILLRWNELIKRQPNRYDGDRYIHAKCMIFEMPDGEKISISGSHNFSAGGVWLGTREVALESRDPDVIAQIEAFIKKEIVGR